MKIGAVIAEYNPFHNGHQYQLEVFRQKHHLDYIIVIMSGNFTQRGEPACMDKHLRARSALLGGADLVLELPVFYALGSAPVFASGAVAHLNRLNCIDYLCFGCETDGDSGRHLQLLEQAADILIHEPAPFREHLTDGLKSGLSYPAAREKALKALMDVPPLLTQPNNILALEYVCALKASASSIRPDILQRKGEGYHSSVQKGDFLSASALRGSLHSAKDLHYINALNGIPDTTRQILETFYRQRLPMASADFSGLFAAAMLSRSGSLTDYCDVTPVIAYRMRRCFHEYTDLDSYLLRLKNRAYTYSRLSRCAAHILLDIPASVLSRARADGYAYYARILGFRQNSRALLTLLKQTASIPMITKMTACPEILHGNGLRLMQADIFAADIYRTACQMKFGQPLKNEYSQPIVII